jgi:hypothetical protein
VNGTRLRTWEIHLVAPTRFLTMNDRRHWRAVHADRNLWRQAAYVACQQAKLPKGVNCRVRVDVRFRFRGRAPVTDLANLHATAKVCLDAAGPRKEQPYRGSVRVSLGYGFLQGDTDRWVEGPFLHKGDPLPKQAGGPVGEVTLTITELESSDGKA